MPTCNICGGRDFASGPGGRLAPSGAPPLCTGCKSLERHRALRDYLKRLPHELLSWRRAIQFAPDPSLDPTWFASFEKSSYGGENSLDLREIDRPADSYDFISLSSVLEFIHDDRRAFQELIRIASSECIIHCTFTPFSATTQHFDTPRGSFGRYHRYGFDLDEWFDVTSYGLVSLVAVTVDPVTHARQPINFFCRQARDLGTLKKATRPSGEHPACAG